MHDEWESEGESQRESQLCTGYHVHFDSHPKLPRLIQKGGIGQIKRENITTQLLDQGEEDLGQDFVAQDGTLGVVGHAGAQVTETLILHVELDWDVEAASLQTSPDEEAELP